MNKYLIRSNLFALIITFFFCNYTKAENVPKHAEGMYEQIVSVDLEKNYKQQGVLSLKNKSDKPKKLVLLFPGGDGVIRPVVIQNNSMMSSKLKGNFLIRARRHLVDQELATLIIDCNSKFKSRCESKYQASLERHLDITKLINKVKNSYPSINEIWLLGTSFGTVSSSFLSIHGSQYYAGAIHTSTITEPNLTFKGGYSILSRFDYNKTKIPQFFIHHKKDPCPLTTYDGAEKISKKFNIPLVTVLGGNDGKGDKCKAHTQHGFKGVEKRVMKEINKIIKNKKINIKEIY